MSICIDRRTTSRSFIPIFHIEKREKNTRLETSVNSFKIVLTNSFFNFHSSLSKVWSRAWDATSPSFRLFQGKFFFTKKIWFLLVWYHAELLRFFFSLSRSISLLVSPKAISKNYLVKWRVSKIHSVTLCLCQGSFFFYFFSLPSLVSTRNTRVHLPLKRHFLPSLFFHLCTNERKGNQLSPLFSQVTIFSIVVSGKTGCTLRLNQIMPGGPGEKVTFTFFSFLPCVCTCPSLSLSLFYSLSLSHRILFLFYWCSIDAIRQIHFILLTVTTDNFSFMQFKM